ncbi:hypothetical protein [Arthrobacter sp. HLT1-21]
MAVKAHRLGPGVLEFGELGTLTQFGSQTTATKLTPSLEEEDSIPVLSGETLDGDDTLTWTLSGTLLQSYDKAGLLHWAYENRLTVLPFKFTPSTAESDYGWKGFAKIIPLEVGGDVKTRNTSDFEFKVIGEPTTFDIPAVV